MLGYFSMIERTLAADELDSANAPGERGGRVVTAFPPRGRLGLVRLVVSVLTVRDMRDITRFAGFAPLGLTLGFGATLLLFEADEG